MGRPAVVAFVTVCMVGLAAPPAGATFPGANGKIAFETYFTSNPYGISIASVNTNGGNRTKLAKFGEGPSWSGDGSKIVYWGGGIDWMNADGTGKTEVLAQGGHPWQFFSDPVWSPDSTKIAFASRGEGGLSSRIAVVNADGTGLVKLASPARQTDPDWSPDGSRIAFVSHDSQGTFVATMDPDGGNVSTVTGCHVRGSPSWSPDGTQLVFIGRSDDVFVVNSDGTDRTRLTDLPRIARTPVFAPDGNQVAYTRKLGKSSGFSTDIWIMDADGSSQRRLTDTPRKSEYGPSWQAT